MDFDDTYEERLAAALASGKTTIVPHRLSDWNQTKGTKEMEVTLNGVKMVGTPDQLSEVARKLGVVLGEDGTWYNSTSRGLILISQMEENHVRNAIAKRYKAHFETLKTLDTQAFAKALQGPQDKTTVALVARLVQIAYEKNRIAYRSSRY